MEDTGRLVLGSLERSYGFLKSRLDFEPKELVVVILYSRRDYSELGGPKWLAGLFDGKVRVPVRGLVNLDNHVGVDAAARVDARVLVRADGEELSPLAAGGHGGVLRGHGR